MDYVQVEFTECTDPERKLGGIAKYENGKLVHILCGCCGHILLPENVTVIRKFDDWLPISEEIIGE